MSWFVILAKGEQRRAIPCETWQKVHALLERALARLLPEAHARLTLTEIVVPERAVHLAGEDWTIDVRTSLQE